MPKLRTLIAFMCLVGPVARAGDDLKIDSHWGTKWDRGSTTTYVKGDFLRVDSCWGGHGTCVNPQEGAISHCGEWSVLRLKRRFYQTSGDEDPASNPASEENAKPARGVVRVTLESVDTGERNVMFGYTARHLVTTASFDLSQSRCAVNETARRYDGWYIDPPYSNKCSEGEVDPAEIDFRDISDCGDKIIVERKGPAMGYGLKETEEYVLRGEHQTSGYVIDAISRENLDPGLFTKPDARPISELHHRGEKAQPQMEERPTTASPR
jgi:hypothetical protein